MERSRRRTFAAVGGTLALASSLLAGTVGPAAAGDGALNVGPAVSCNGLANLDDPNTATGISTVAQGVSSTAGTAQVRAGRVNGVQYGWARAVNGSTAYGLRFEIDTDGNRVGNCAVYIDISSARYWTSGTQTSASSNVAFRACILSRASENCDDSVSVTQWW